MSASKSIPSAWRRTFRKPPNTSSASVEWDWYRFEPARDILAFEVAYLLRYMRDLGLPLLVPRGSDLKRHFLLDRKGDIGRHFVRIAPDKARFPRVVHLTNLRQ